MALEALPGNQFWERLKLYVTDSKRLKTVVRGEHNMYLDKVPMDVTLKFTALQLFGFALCYGITWGGAVGAIFPVFIMLIVPFRKSIMPKSV